MKKRITCALLLTAVLGAGVNAQAFGGTYPVHPTSNPPVVEQEVSKMNCWTPSDSEYVFEVGGKKFVLLDTDSEGNYFIIAEEEYGKYPFTTAYTNNPTIETYIKSGGEVTYGQGAAHDMDDTAWRFNTENPTSIGYWLNNEFLEEGNGSSYILPDEIKSAIIEKEWQVEGYKPVASWTAANYGGDSQHVTDFINSRYQDGYTVTGKLSLISYTEYKKYEEIIGWQYSALGWDGFMLRTPYALITGDANSLTYKFGSMQVRNRTAAVNTDGGMLIVGNDVPNSSNHFVRPVMWLDKDFFAETALDLSSAGDIVKGEIKKNSMASLSEIYSDEELELLGFDVAGAPKAEKASVAGTPAEGAELYAEYNYSSESGVDEGSSEIEWFISNTEDGEYTPIGVTGKFIETDSSMTGKYLRCRVMPKDSTGNAGKYYWSEPSSAIAAMNIPIVSDVNVTETSAGITVKNNASGNKNIKILKAVYDSYMQLVSVDETQISIPAGQDITQNVDITGKPDNGKVSVMVWIEESQPILYLSL